MKFWFKFLMLTVTVCFYFKTVNSSNCFWSSECKYNFFSSKTPYEFVRGDIRDSIFKPKGCEPISIWTIMRHGKKNPGMKFLKEIKVVLEFKDDIISSYENGNSTLCAQDVDNLRDWEIDQTFINEPNRVTGEGYHETFGIGSRLKEALPEIFNDVQEEDYLVRTTFGPRTQFSAEAFIDGLKYKNLRIVQDNEGFSIANPYLSCGRFVKEVLDNAANYYRISDYMKTPDYLSMKERVEKKLGLNFTLTHKNIVAMYDVCRYTWNSIAKKPSPWCTIFSVEDLKVMEYIGDLEHFSRSGYGVSQYSNTFGQIPLADLLIKFEQAKNGTGKKIVAYFTHSSMMDMVLVALNLFKDASPLTGTHRDLKRKWRTTFISTFGVNLIAVLNRCKQSEANEYEHKIVFYWNESPILELCNEGVCSWKEFEDKLKPFLNATIDFCDKSIV